MGLLSKGARFRRYYGGQNVRVLVHESSGIVDLIVHNKVEILAEKVSISNHCELTPNKTVTFFELCSETSA